MMAGATTDRLLWHCPLPLSTIASHQYILSTDTPELRDMSGPMQGMACLAAWGKQPDRFDMYSAGLILMQMSVPKLRTTASINAFSQGEALGPIALWLL